MSCDVLPGGEQLIARIRAEASQPNVRRIRLALGYLFVPGLAPVWQALEESSATDIQLLIGNTAGVLTDEQRIAAATLSGMQASVARVEPEMDMAASARAERDRIVAETAEALRDNLLRLPTGGDNGAFLLHLARVAGSNRLRVRIYPDGRLHAKGALFEAEAGSVAIVGSSNVTLPSHGNPTELNVVLHDSESIQAVSGWFERLWDAGQDFTRALFLEVSARAAIAEKPAA